MNNEDLQSKIENHGAELNILKIIMLCEEYPANVKVQDVRINGGQNGSVSFEILVLANIEHGDKQHNRLIHCETFNFKMKYFLERFSELMNSFGVIDSKMLKIEKVQHAVNRSNQYEAEEREVQEYIIVEELEGEEIISFIPYRMFEKNLQKLIDEISLSK